MTRTSFIFTFHSVLLGLIFILATSCKQTDKSSTSYKDLSVAQAAAISTSQKVKFLDVRTPGEIEEGKIDGAICLDYRSDDFSEQLGKLDKSQNYIVYCRSGGRSANASEMMTGMGFKQVNNLLGGYTEWKKQNKN